MKHSIYIFGLGYLLYLTTLNVYAAEVVFKVVPDSVPQETVTLVEVRLDSGGAALNAIEGVVGFTGEGADDVSSVIIETGGSALAFWPQPPVFSEEEKVVRFTGGTIGNLPSDGLLFRMRIFSKQANTLSLSWIGGAAYKNDGLGTREAISSRSLSISVAQSTLNKTNQSSVDSAPPVFDYVEVSKDTDTFDGKYFVSFKASDAISGIDRYEVVEGQIKTINNDGVYVLQDQDRKSKVVVIAYDKAGNSNSIRVATTYEWFFDYRFSIPALLLLLMLGAFVVRRKRRRG